ncbi:DUF1360 domain-containing protein [Aneurinibacillus thermoaerophilus]|uniref:DUF1360 domain-containing protein n=1 Tax=Aneurinibacillus thermoaerophilus TaxID=143495 RepID=UPI002E2293F1|nr:DUF1360 domain-containing protein [Aneurinibacillus thermoaerophilus]
MPELSWIHLVILIFASFRLTHLLVFDEITSFIRAPFLAITHEEDVDGQTIQHIEIKGTGLRRLIGKLLSCYWCVGIWSAALVVTLYWFLPTSFIFLVILAIAGAAALIESKT